MKNGFENQWARKKRVASSSPSRLATDHKQCLGRKESEGDWNLLRPHSLPPTESVVRHREQFPSWTNKVLWLMHLLVVTSVTLTLYLYKLFVIQSLTPRHSSRGSLSLLEVECKVKVTLLQNDACYFFVSLRESFATRVQETGGLFVSFSCFPSDADDNYVL